MSRFVYQGVELGNRETESMLGALLGTGEFADEPSGPELRRRLVQEARSQKGDKKLWLANALDDTIGNHVHPLDKIGDLASELLTTALFNVDFPAVAEALLLGDGRRSTHAKVEAS